MGRGVSARVQLLWLTVAHGTVDAYALMVPFLLPILLEGTAGRPGLSPPGQRELYAGVFAAMSAASTSLGQLGFALLADRARNAAFLWGGLAVAAFGMSLVGLAPNLPLAFALVLIGGMGVAAFHPQATVAARLVSKAQGLGVSVFVTGGNIGQSVGPFLLIVALSAFGPRAFAPAMIPGIALALLLIPTLSGVVNGNGETRRAERPTGPIPYRALGVLFALVVLRTLAFTGFLNFLSLYLKDRGFGDIARAGVMSGFIFFGSVGMLLGGLLSDRLPRTPLLLASLLLPSPAWIGVLHTQGLAFFGLLFLGNFLFQFSTPIYIVLGQEAMPERANVATSLMMGTAWGTAGLLALPVGAIANSIGLTPTLTGLALIPVAAVVLLLAMPKQSDHDAKVLELSAS